MTYVDDAGHLLIKQGNHQPENQRSNIQTKTNNFNISVQDVSF